MARWAWRLVVVTALALSPVAWPATAQAHGDEEQEGYVLIQQALAHLAHDSGPEGVEMALEKTHDALETEDHEGMDVTRAEEAVQALEAGRIDEARTRLEASIAEALRDRPLATGLETGTATVPAELPGRGSLRGGDWVVLALSMTAMGLGAWLAARFRPHESVGALQLLLGSAPTDADRRTRAVPISRPPR